MPTTSIPNLRWAGHRRGAAFLTWALCQPCAAAPPAEAAVLKPETPANCAAQIPAATADYAPDGYRELLLVVDINRQQMDEPALVLQDKKGMLFLWARDVERWRLRPPEPCYAIEHQGETYFPLSALRQVSHVYNQKDLTLTIEVRPGAFVSSRLFTRYDVLPPPVKPGPGGFINYDLSVSRAPGSVQNSGLIELGYFNAHGVGTSSLLASEIDGHFKSTRLDTTWTADNPEKLRTLRLGDAINVPGRWGRSVRFGGIQYGTNFATQPGFVTFPSQRITGEAVVPSTVDVLVNNALVSRQTVPPGPFSISNLPVVTGAGEVQLVMRDLLGREQAFTRPFYASQALLRTGLKTFSYEFGFVRENFGIDSNNYGKWLGSGTYRRGLTDNLTGEVHADAMPGQATAGAGGDYLLSQIGTFSANAAGSHSNAGNGGLALLGFDRQAHPWSLGARTQWTSRNFAQVGQVPPALPPVQASSANLSYTAGIAGAVSFAYIGQHNRDQPDTRLATMSYSVNIGTFGSFSISALRNLSGDKSTTIFALLNIPLGASTNLSMASQSVRGAAADNRTVYTTTLQKNLPLGEGYGYRVQTRSDNATEGALSLQNDIGTYTVEAAQTQGSTATRLGVSGGVAVLGGDAFLSRRIDQSFAVARIPDYPNVRILTDNQPAGRTDADGNALIPRLRAYDVNVISIDQRDVPMNAKIDALRAEAVPYYRSGVDVTFPIGVSRGATFTVVLDNGTRLPVGASVQKVGDTEIYPVGFNGEVYVVGLGASTRLRASWKQQSCEFTVPFTPGADPLPDLGVFTCKGVNP
jgi:outer membrane usher protein